VARVKPGQPFAEILGLRHSLEEVIELAEIEVGIVRGLQSTPDDRLRTKVGCDGVDGSSRFILPFQSLEPMEAKRNLSCVLALQLSHNTHGLPSPLLTAPRCGFLTPPRPGFTPSRELRKVVATLSSSFLKLQQVDHRPQETEKATS
jgi:hypothetical protein